MRDDCNIEAEYVALCDAAKEAIFVRTVLVFLQP